MTNRKNLIIGLLVVTGFFLYIYFWIVVKTILVITTLYFWYLMIATDALQDICGFVGPGLLYANADRYRNYGSIKLTWKLLDGTSKFLSSIYVIRIITIILSFITFNCVFLQFVYSVQGSFDEQQYIRQNVCLHDNEFTFTDPTLTLQQNNQLGLSYNRCKEKAIAVLLADEELRIKIFIIMTKGHNDADIVNTGQLPFLSKLDKINTIAAYENLKYMSLDQLSPELAKISEENKEDARKLAEKNAAFLKPMIVQQKQAHYDKAIKEYQDCLVDQKKKQYAIDTRYTIKDVCGPEPVFGENYPYIGEN